MVDAYADYQFEIYGRGVQGWKPGQSFDLEKLRRAAEDILPPEAYGYVAGGASSEATMDENRAAFARHRIVPRMLRGVATRDLSTSILGRSLRAPIMLAPVGIQTIVHPEGELATARAAAAVGLTLIQSTVGSYTLEEVAAANGEGARWFQLYWPGDPALAASFLDRAEHAGYEAVVVTLDTFHLGWRPRDLDQAYLPFLTGTGIANYLADPVFRSALVDPPEHDVEAAGRHFASVFSDAGLTWDDLEDLRDRSRLPMLVKGIQHPDDARRALDSGMDGVVVSNHGGRQVDGAIGSLDVLPAVTEAVGGTMAVLFDSGVRTGSDVLKALALGADAVLIGRPWVWGLACGGEAGVEQVLRALLADFDLAMALSGHSRLDELGPEALVRASDSK